MSRKNVTRACVKKIKDVSKSLPNEEMRKLFFNNAMICGGAINSLYMGTKVNDWDIYLKDTKACLPLIEHWIEGCNVSVRTEPNRIKIEKFANSDEYFLKKINKPVEEHEKYFPKAITNNAISLDGNVQIVMRFTGNPDVITETFDFEHAKIVYNFSTNDIHSSQEALESMLFKRLYYTGSHYPIASMFRMRKFIKRGWNISAGQMAKIAFQINALDLSDRAVLREQLIGVDMLYMSAFLSKMDRDGVYSLDSDYVSNLLDDIFDFPATNEEVGEDGSPF